MTVATLLLATLVNQLVPGVGAGAMPSGVDIPIVCDARDAILVPVSVHGAPARPFLLDTGSSITMIDERVASGLALAAAGRIASPLGSDPLVTAQLTVGPVALPPARVVTADVRRLANLLGHIGGNVGGILGSDALRAMGSTTIDYARCRLTVGGSAADLAPLASATIREAEGRLEARRTTTRLPLQWHEGRPVIAVTGGARLVLDSGAATVTLFSDTPAAATLKWNSRAVSIVRIDRVDGPRMGRLGELACVTIGDIELKDIAAVGVRSWYDKRDATAPDGLLPLGLFAQVHLSHAEGYVVLVPGPLPPTPPPSH